MNTPLGNITSAAEHAVAMLLSLAATIELVKIRTRQYAKRQMTWFRRDPRIIWLDAATATPTLPMTWRTTL